MEDMVNVDLSEIEITPEMIEAGTRILRNHFWVSEDEYTAEAAKELFCEMA